MHMHITYPHKCRCDRANLDAPQLPIPFRMPTCTILISTLSSDRRRIFLSFSYRLTHFTSPSSPLFKSFLLQTVLLDVMLCYDYRCLSEQLGHRNGVMRFSYPLFLHPQSNERIVSTSHHKRFSGNHDKSAYIGRTQWNIYLKSNSHSKRIYRWKCGRTTATAWTKIDLFVTCNVWLCARRIWWLSIVGITHWDCQLHCGCKPII